MRSVYLYLVTPFGFHLPQSEFRVFEHNCILNVTEADADTRCVGHSMSSHANDIGWEDPSGGPKHEL